MASTIGMMDEAYFVGRNELLAWIRSVTGVALGKVEEACTGAVYCQVIEALHPGTIKLAQVKTKARSEYDYICNFKLLQKAFDKLRIQKVRARERTAAPRGGARTAAPRGGARTARAAL